MGPDRLVAALGSTNDLNLQKDMLRGMGEALKEKREAPAPKGWAAVGQKLREAPNGEVRELATNLAVLFGDAGALGGGAGYGVEWERHGGATAAGGWGCWCSIRTRSFRRDCCGRFCQMERWRGRRCGRLAAYPGEETARGRSSGSIRD